MHQTIAAALTCALLACSPVSDATVLQQCQLAASCYAESTTTYPVGIACNWLGLYSRGAFANDRGTESRTFGSLYSCLMQARDCAAMRRCNQATPEQRAQCSTSAHAVCAGNAVVHCTRDASDPIYVTPCATAGLVCGADDSGATCGERACAPGTPDACEADLVVRCRSGVRTTEDCARSGGTCGTPANSTQPTCVGGGPACDSTFVRRCDGTVLVSCSHGREARTDCAVSYGLVCGTHSSDGQPQCEPANAECPFEKAEACDQATLKFCFLGKPASVDCQALGYARCLTQTLGTTTWGYCSR